MADELFNFQFHFWLNFKPGKVRMMPCSLAELAGAIPSSPRFLQHSRGGYAWKSLKRFFLPKFLVNSSAKQPLSGVSLSEPSSCVGLTESLARWIVSFFPFFIILRKYDFKEWFLNDLIAGITIGIMHVPQGMAYAMLATLPPVNGLYTSFFPPLVYFFFGTSRHISMDFRSSSPNASDFYTTGRDNTTDWNNLRVQYASAVTMGVGIMQFLMGVMQMGGVIRYLSGPMISGFTVGVAVHVFTSQIKTVFGVKIVKPMGLFTIPLTYYRVFASIRTANLVTVALCIVCIIVLLIFKEVINPRVVKRIRVPIPIDLVVVIFSTVASYYLDLNGRYNVQIVGHVSRGMPTPYVPQLYRLRDAISDILVMGIVAFSVNASLSSIFAKTYGYKIDCNQELFAYGITNMAGSFFQTYPAAASLSRSAVQVSAGGKTQVATIYSSFLLILVLYFIGPLFHDVPQCIGNAAIQVVRYEGNVYYACAEHFRHAIYKQSGLDPEYLHPKLLKLIKRLQKIERDLKHSQSSQNLPTCHGDNEVCTNNNCTEAPGFTDKPRNDSVRQGSESLFCQDTGRTTANTNGWRSQSILSVVTIPADEEQNFKLKECHSEVLRKIAEIDQMLVLQYLVLDCSCWTFIDFAASDELCQVIKEYEKLSVSVLIADLKGDLASALVQSEKIPSTVELFPTVHDAVMSAKARLKSQTHHLSDIHVLLGARAYGDSIPSEQQISSRPEVEDFPSLAESLQDKPHGPRIRL
ncbi:unnamed protein product [Calicophoron daubneyi]|uniref:STAS domain-containing protein n=1 Tax=Calicophoron daubneyi TaxID=300641 RepID=A0AAV2TS70_CALDB